MNRLFCYEWLTLASLYFPFLPFRFGAVDAAVDAEADEGEDEGHDGSDGNYDDHPHAWQRSPLSKQLSQSLQALFDDKLFISYTKR